MTRKLLIILFLSIALTACPHRRMEPVSGPPESIESPADISREPAPTSSVIGPNLSLELYNSLLKDVLSGLCVTGYKIYLGSAENFIVFRELKGLRGFPADGEVELNIRLDFSVKKLLIRYRDEAHAAVRLKFSTVKKDGKIFLRGFGRCSSLRTRFGPALDERVLKPRINREMAKGPLFEVPLTEIAHVIVPWPKLGDSARITELNLEDVVIEIQPASVVFHLKIIPETRLPEDW